MKKQILITMICLMGSGPLMAASKDKMQQRTLYQMPTVSKTMIVFAFAGDLWRVPREGGVAVQLTTDVGIENRPSFSPDGKLVAFTGQYDGNTDVFVVDATGGVPRRLTYHPQNDIAVGWTNDGKNVLFNSPRDSYKDFPRLFTIGIGGGYPTDLPLPTGERGSFSPDGTAIAYEPMDQWQPSWKRYHGGQQDYIWIAKLEDSSITKIPHGDSNDKMPMWIDDKIYFLSDQNSKSGRVTLFSYDLNSKEIKREIKHKGLDILSASAGPGAIVYEQFGTIGLFDVKTGKNKKVDIHVAMDAVGTRPRYEKVGTRIANGNISPTGVRAVFEARGEIMTLPAKKGNARNITKTPGVMERDPSWSPNGKWIAYFSDASGEYALHLRDQKGEKAARVIELPPTFYYAPTWSPDSKKIAIIDKKIQLWYIDLEKKDDLKPIRIDSNPVGFRDGVLTPNWSPDSQWITYSKQLNNLLRAVFVYSLETGKNHQITDGMSDARNPTFDAGGKFLYFTASTNDGTLSFADMSTMGQQLSRGVYAAVLPNDLASPLAPESDEEKVSDEEEESEDGKDKGKDDKDEDKAKDKDDKDKDKGKDKAKGKGDKKEQKPTRIDLEGIQQRIIALPIPLRDWTDLQAGKEKTIYLLENLPAGPDGRDGPRGQTLHSYDLKKRKLKKVMSGINRFVLSANREKALYRKGRGWSISATGSLGKPPGPGGSGPLKTNEMEVYVVPRAEWKQMYHEVWRGERDFFYDANSHGLDLKAAEKMYEPYLSGVMHRNDLNYLFREMCNQLTIGHMFIRGGDQPRAKRVPGGLLGADYTLENGRYRFSKIFSGENWNPDLRAPLTEPGINVKVGEYLLEVDGRELRSALSIYHFFESKADKLVVIKVGPNPDGTDAREVTVKPVANERGLRHRDWVEGNRRKVDKLSGGKLAYIYVPNTGGQGFTSFNRYFYSQTDKQGAIIDERFNSGGLLADHVAQLLTRQQFGMIHYRYGDKDVPVPAGAIYGPKAMLINEQAGSGGDAMPWVFKKAKIGPLIGKRTWGGLVASFGLPRLMDGGGVTAPDAAVYGLDGKWEVENYGVAPDIEVEHDPALWRKGQDPQLEAAVDYLLKEIEKNPKPEIKLPAFPDYHKHK